MDTMHKTRNAGPAILYALGAIRRRIFALSVLKELCRLTEISVCAIKERSLMEKLAL